MMRQILIIILKYLSKLTLWRHKPLVIGITGSVGKTSTKEAIFTVLDARWPGRIRRNKENLNTAIGIPLTIIGGVEANRNILLWASNIVRGLWVALFSTSYPRALVLELAADHPGDIQHFVTFIALDVAVITAIGETPAHLEFFEHRERYVQEKATILQALKQGGVGVLNGDDGDVRAMGGNTPVRFYYGKGEDSDVRAYDVQYHIDSTDPAEIGMTIKLESDGSTVSIRTDGALGDGVVYFVCAATAVARAIGIHLELVVESFSTFTPLAGRMRLIDGIKHTLLIDDSYNSSPLAAKPALDVLGKFEKMRRIVVFGDMLELGRQTERAHRDIAASIAVVADQVFLIGEAVVFTEEELVNSGFPEQNIHRFEHADEARILVEDEIIEGDVVLIKGSQSTRTEKVTKEIMARPKQAKYLLVRQYGHWLKDA